MFLSTASEAGAPPPLFESVMVVIPFEDLSLLLAPFYGFGRYGFYLVCCVLPDDVCDGANP